MNNIKRLEVDEFWADFVDIKNHYLYHKDITKNKIHRKSYIKKDTNNTL